MNTNPFDGLKNAEVFERGSYLPEGRFDCRIIRCIYKDTFKSGMAFIAEMEVLSSSNPDVEVGSTKSFYQSFQYKDTAMSVIKAFVVALHGYDSSDRNRIKNELDPRIAELTLRATSPENSFRGKCIHIEGFPHTTKKGTEVTNYRFSPYQGDACEGTTFAAVPSVVATPAAPPPPPQPVFDPQTGTWKLPAAAPPPPPQPVFDPQTGTWKLP